MKTTLLFLFLTLWLTSNNLLGQVNPTGAANISLPLYTLKEGSINVPVGIFYDATGIKTDAMSSWVGLNWHLQSGAKVQRIVRDKADEAGFGYLPIINGSAQPNNFLGFLDAGFIDINNFDNQQWMFAKDLEPDIFILTIDGMTVYFYLKYNISTNKVEIILQNQNADIKIEALEYEGTLTSPPVSPVQDALFINSTRKNYEGLNQKAKLFYFKVTLNNGLIYWFGEQPEDREYAFTFKEYSYRGTGYDFAGNALQDFELKVPFMSGEAKTVNQGRQISSPHTWNVSRIVAYKGLNTAQNSTDILQQITFNYKFVHQIKRTAVSTSEDFAEYGTNVIPTDCPSITSSLIVDIQEKPIFFSSQLSSIESENFKIEFNSEDVLGSSVSTPTNLSVMIPALATGNFKNTLRTDVIYAQDSDLPSNISYYSSIGGFVPPPPPIPLPSASQSISNPIKSVEKAEKLHNITIIDKVSNKKIGYYFDYDYYTTYSPVAISSTSYIQPSEDKLKLSGIYPLEFQEDGTIQLRNGYLFGYNNAIFANGWSFARDHWGFYNGRDNLNKSNIIEIAPKRDYDNFNSIQLTCLSSDKSAYEEPTKRGILTSITLPTGGTNIYEYELNDCDNYQTEIQASTLARIGQRGVGGLRVKSVKQIDPVTNAKYRTKYTYTKKDNPDESSGFLSVWPEYYMIRGNKMDGSTINGYYHQYLAPNAIDAVTSRLINGYCITYRTISVEQVKETSEGEENNGVTIYEFDNRETEPFSVYSGDQFHDENASTSAGLCYSRFLRIYNFPSSLSDPPVLPVFDFYKGLPTKTTVYKRNGETLIPISEVSYNYEVADLTNTVNMSAAMNLVQPQVKIDGKFLTKSAVDDFKKMVGIISTTGYIFPAIAPFSKVARIIGASINILYNISNKEDESTYYLLPYKVPIGRVRLQSVIEKKYDVNQSNISLETTTKYDYSPTNLHSQPIKITSGKSINGVISTADRYYEQSIKYSSDYTDISTATTNTDARGILGLQQRSIIVPIEKIAKVNGKIVTAGYNEYHYANPNASGDEDSYVGFLKADWKLETEDPILSTNFTNSSYNTTTNAIAKDSRYVPYNFFKEYNERGLINKYNFNQASETSLSYSNTYNGFLPTLISKSGFAKNTEYTPLYGVTKMTSPNNTYIENKYDQSGRLKEVKDHKQKLVISYNYNEAEPPAFSTDDYVFELWSDGVKILDLTNNANVPMSALSTFESFDIIIKQSRTEVQSILSTLKTTVGLSNAETYQLFSNKIRDKFSETILTENLNIPFVQNQVQGLYTLKVDLYSQKGNNGFLLGSKEIVFNVY